MTSAQTTAFALPSRLSAKADPRLIADDEKHFCRISSALDAAVAAASARLDSLRRAPVGTGAVAVERDLEIHRLAARLRTLQRFGLDLCLGRMMPADGTDPVYIGRLGLADDDGERLLVDWRAPAAEPFFAASHGDPRGLSGRRRYRWSAGRVSDYWDEMFTPEGLADPTALDDQSAFIASLGSSRTPRMRDVLATIQADQDAVIRAGSRGALVVDGGPGTGKTVVALHRAAYLLYSEPRMSRGGGGVLVVGPHQPYLAYVDDVLPRLGEDEVRTCTLRDLVSEGAKASTERDPRVVRLKSSRALVDAVDAAVALYEQPPSAALRIETPWADLRLSPADWETAFDSVEPGTAHNDAREQIEELLVEILSGRLGGAVPASALRRELGADEGLRTTLDRAWPVLDPVPFVAGLWSSPAVLRRCAPLLTEHDVLLLRRDPSAEWTTSDLPILDAARRRIGDPGGRMLRQERSTAKAAERAYRADIADYLRASSDDDLGLMSMLQSADVQNSLDDDTALPASADDPLAGPFAHIIVDEAQELTDAEWRMLLRRCPSRSFTIVGDRAQARHGFAEPWETRLRRVGFSEVRRASLTVNYRTPEEVMAEAEPVIRAEIPDANVPTSIRSSGVPVRSAPFSERDTILARWSAAQEEGTACVIGDPTLADSERVRSLTPESAKGLEFDLVLLATPDQWGDGIEGAVDRYVAMTRTTRELVILEG